MSNPFRETPPWGKASGRASSRARPGDGSEPPADPTAPQTQFAPDRDDYLGESSFDVGRQTGAHEFEFFVGTNPAPALQQRFEDVRPVFIAVHDVGTSSSRKLLSSVASANKTKTQKLVIRRQGQGTALATVHFVELPSPDGKRLRMYSTDCDTEPMWRQSMVHMLLAFSRLGVIMVGDLKSDEIARKLGRLREGMLRGPWHNEQMLLLPLGSAISLVNHGMELANGTRVHVRTTPQVARATDAWGFISGIWGRLIEAAPPASSTVSALSRLIGAASPPPPAPSAPADAPRPGHAAGPQPAQAAANAAQAQGPVLLATPASRPERAPPALPTAAQAARPTESPPRVAEADATRTQANAPAPAQAVTARLAALAPTPTPTPTPTNANANPAQAPTPSSELLQRYVNQIGNLPGVVGCAVFHTSNGKGVTLTWQGPHAQDVAAQSAELMTDIIRTSRALGIGGKGLPEAAITLDAHHMLLRAIPRHPGLAVLVVLDKAKANLTLVRVQVLRMDELFGEAG